MTDESLPPPVDVDPDKLRRLEAVWLRRLARGDNPVLAEMAREVQSGRMTLRDAVTSSAYSETLTKVVERVVAQRTVEERQRAVDPSAIDEYLAQHETPDEEDDEPAEQTPPPTEATDEEFSAPIMHKEPPRRTEQDSRPQRARWNRRWS
jgi:hypothetical protein